MEGNFQNLHQTILDTAAELAGREEKTGSYAGLKELTEELLFHLRVFHHDCQLQYRLSRANLILYLIARQGCLDL